MALIKPDEASFAKIKVLGLGGGGGNALNTMIEDGQINGVEFVAINTDAQALLINKAEVKVQIGEKLTRGLGSGGNPETGQKAAQESKEKVKEYLTGADMIFLAGGEGGGTFTGGAPIIAEIAREVGALTIAVVTKPFDFEGARRRVIAEEGIESLKDKVDTLIVVPNQKILDVVDKKVTLVEAFKIVDGVLTQGVKGISDIITVPGLINIDFADVKTVMSDAGSSLLGIGTGVGENRAQTAVRAAIASPLIDISIQGAKGILLNITGGPDLTMAEVDEAARLIAQEADADANIIFGAVVDENLREQIRVTVIATGFDEARARLAKMVAKKVEPKPPEGIVSELPEERKKEEIEKIKLEDEEELPEEDKYEIPTFLRQGKMS